MGKAKAEKNETKQKKKKNRKKRGRIKKEVRSGLCVCVPANLLG